MRHRTAFLIRQLRGRAQRYPRSAFVGAAPTPRRAGAAALRPSHVLLASDLNAYYLDTWPLAKRAWPAIAGLDPILVLVAKQDEIPRELQNDEAVHVFEPIEGVHTALQAQCVRLLYPALVDGSGVITADIDMLPLNRSYFHRAVERIDARDFVAYRNVLLAIGQIPMCYTAAHPHTWREVFGVSNYNDVRERLAGWAKGVIYEGVRGGAGWDTDQLILHRAVTEWAARTGRAWILDDHFTRFRRLERWPLQKHGDPTARERRLIARGSYSDFHCLVPQSEYRELNELVIQLAGA